MRFALLCAFALLIGCGSTYGVFHNVKRGQTLYSISRAYGVSVEELKEANRLGASDRIIAGDRLFIPGGKRSLSTGEVKRTNTPAKRSINSPLQKPKVAKTPSSAPKGLKLAWPVRGRVLNNFTAKSRGIDISAAKGVTVASAGKGVVNYANTPAPAYGPLVIVDHGSGWFTVYSNLASLSVNEGDRVWAGTKVGTVGRGRRGLGPHLHFELRNGEMPRDPLELLPKSP